MEPSAGNASPPDQLKQIASSAVDQSHASETRSAIRIDEPDANSDDVVLFDATRIPRASSPTKSPSTALSSSSSASPSSSTSEAFDDDAAAAHDANERASELQASGEFYDEEDALKHEPRASSLMNFDAFVAGGELSFLPIQAAQEQDYVDAEESDDNEHSQCSLGTPDDDDDDYDHFRDAFESDDTPSATPRRSRVSLGSISSMRSAAVAASAASLVLVKEKTQQVAQSKKHALSEFQKKGGLVGWLHGEPDDDDDDDDSGDCDDNDEELSDPRGPSAQCCQPTAAQELSEGSFYGNSEPEGLRSASLPSDPATSSSQQATSASAQVNASRQHRSFPTHQPPASSAARFLSKSIGGRQRASSLFENLYGKVKRSTSSPAATPPRSPTRTGGAPGFQAESPASAIASGRVALQPSPRKEQTASGDPYSFGFDEFVAASGEFTTTNDKVAGLRGHRQHRSVSADSSLPSSRPQAPSFQKRLSGSLFLQEEENSEKEILRHLTLNECLGDPKLAAEFVNTVMPDDSALLKLLYSIEEYEALVATTEPTAAFNVQAAYATTMIDNFLVNHQPSALRKVPPSTASDLKLVIDRLQIADAQTLPKSLFKEVYEVVYETLRDGYEAFKLTREYALLVEQQERSTTATTSVTSATTVNVLTIDAILLSEWSCTVFWMHLYPTSHHHRLSFLMDKAFKLDALYQDFISASRQPPAVSTEPYERLVAQLKLVNHKFLHKTAPVALPVAAARLCRLKEEICMEISHLSPRLSLSGDTDTEACMATVAVERVMGKLDAFAFDLQNEFKRLSFERFASFTASALYRDFVAQLQPISSTASADGVVSGCIGDIVQLLRASRIPFHQAPNESPQALDLASLLSIKDGDEASIEVAGDAIFKVLSFVKRDGVNAQKRTQPYELVDLLAEEKSQLEAHHDDALLYQTLEHFLIPEAAPRTFQISDAEAQQSLCFNFVAGNGENAVYGALWRVPLVQSDGITTQGLCVLSKYPLVDSLRHYLRSFSQSKMRLDATKLPNGYSSDSPSGILSGDLSPALAEARSAFERHFVTQHQGSLPKASEALVLPRVDISLEDLFDCLSLTHIIRLVGFVLLEKKIVLVSSSYSVLLSVGEALKTLIHPLVWSHICVPVLPLALKGYLHCPTPFIFGLHNSYVRTSELPRPSDDLVVVNLDRDSLTGGGEVFLPPTRSASIRERLVRICRPRLQNRDQVDYCCSIGGGSSDTAMGTREFPSEAIRSVFHDELRDMLAGLETFAFRFAFNNRFVTVVDASNKSRAWTSDASRFHATLLQTQAFSAHLSSLINL